MQYMLLIYLDQHGLTEAQRETCYLESAQFAHELNAKGEYLAAAPLHPTATATSVRLRDGKRVVTGRSFCGDPRTVGRILPARSRPVDFAALGSTQR